MNAVQAIGAAALLAASAGAVGWAIKPRTAGRHRVTPRFVPLDELLGPRTAYTEFEHAPGVVRQGFDYCVPCDRNTVGVAHRDGSWTCGECLTTSAVA